MSIETPTERAARKLADDVARHVLGSLASTAAQTTGVPTIDSVMTDINDALAKRKAVPVRADCGSFAWRALHLDRDFCLAAHRPLSSDRDLEFCGMKIVCDDDMPAGLVRFVNADGETLREFEIAV